MVNIDWKRVMAIRPESMTEQDKDELYESVAWYIPESNLERRYLGHFIRIAQEILKFKAEQVESLMNELDEIAARQGEDEARRQQDLVEEIEDLKEQLEYYKRLDRDSSRPALASGEEMRSEIVKLEMQNEELLYELQEREKELMNEKAEVENYASQVATLEREKLELSRELNALQEETTERLNAKNLRDSPEFGPEKQEELTETIRRKNKHISQLLEDIETIEKENLSLRTKLSNVRDELAEATKHITEMTKEISKLKHFNEENDKKVKFMQEQNKGLTTQIEELVQEKSKHDKQLDDFAVTLNVKVQEWKNILDAKDNELSKLKEELKKVMPSSTMMMSSDLEELELNQKVSEQAEQIKTLKSELLKATDEINHCSELIENLKEREGNSKLSNPELSQSQLVALEDKIVHLEEKLKYAEEDAHLKAEEMSDLVIQIRKFETGEFGLSEAMNKIRKLEKNVQKKDSQIEQLIEHSNHMEIEFENLEDQNMALREKLGISASEDIDTSQVKLKFKKDVQMIENLKVQLEKKDEDLLKVKLKNRKLVKLLRRSTELDVSVSESEDSKKSRSIQIHNQEKADLESKLLSVIKENDALRKGMHEILESIHAQDCSGTVEVQSATLERLLEALDSRHVSGWYHPAMRLQAQVNSIEGKNEELRNQIRILRAEQMKKSNELEEANVQIQSLQNDLLVSQKLEEQAKSKSRSAESGTAEEIEEEEVEEEEEDGEVNVGSKSASVTNIEQEQKMIELEMELQELKLIFDKKNFELEKLEGDFTSEKEDLLSKIEVLENQVKFLENKHPEISEVAQKTSQLFVCERKINYLSDMETVYKKKIEKLRDELIEMEEKLIRDMIRLQREKLVMLTNVEKLKKQLLASVSKEKFDIISEELSSVTSKYQQAVNLSMTKYDDNAIEKLQSEINLLQNEKQCVLDELRIAKEKLIAEGMLNSDVVTNDTFSNQISILAGKLAASEVREMNEKQKSSHLEKVNLMIRSEQQELEAHNKELSEYINRLTEQNSKLKEVERELQTQMQKFRSQEEFSNLLQNYEVLEMKYKELLTEKENVQELFEISQDQCRSLQNWREMHKLEISSKNEQFLLLQSSSEDKAIISRLSHEILTEQLSSSQLSKTNNDLQNKVSKLLTQNMCLETNIDDLRRKMFKLKQKHLAEVEYLYGVIEKVRKLYSNATIFPDVESIHNLKISLKQEKDEVRVRLSELKSKIHEYSSKREEAEVQLDAIENLKEAIKGDNKNLMKWHNKSTELRLKEARSRRQNEFLVGEMMQLENCMKKLNQEVMNLEEKSFEKEKECEQKQILWEKSQYELCQLLQDKGIKGKSKISVREQSTDTEPLAPVQASTENVDHLWKIINEQTEKMKENENSMRELDHEIRKLKKLIDEKEAIILLKEKLANNINSKPKTLELEETVSRDKTDEAEKAALKVTVQSLQNIIAQKEETIFRYQNLLKEGREEHAKASSKLQDELRTLHETLNNQNKVLSRLKNNTQIAPAQKEGISTILEKYISRIHELEEELTESQSNLSSLNNQLLTVKQEAEKWRNVANDRLFLMDDMQQRLEIEYKNEIESFKEEIQNYQSEVDHLKQLLDSAEDDVSDGHNHKLIETIQQLQAKLLQYEGRNNKGRPNSGFEHPVKLRSPKEVESLKRQLKAAKEECGRLREQIRMLQVQRSRKSGTGSLTNRSSTSLKEESLQSKIKTLEELLQISKDRERELLESSQQRIKSAEEVVRWDEKKRSQQTIDQLHSKLKEKDVEIEVLKNKNESFRNMIHRCEREKNVLESQIKATKGISVNARIEKLTSEKNRLEEEVLSLKEQLEAQQRHEGGLGAALLHEKLEAQERKLAVLELSSQGNSYMVDELERLKSHISNLEKTNLKLESENLSLELKLGKEKAETCHLNERIHHLEKLAAVHEVHDDSEIRQMEMDRKITTLQDTVEKLTAENKRLRNMSNKESKVSYPNDKTRKEFLKLKDEHKKIRSQYLTAMERNASLEEELKKCRYQIHLLEEKDLAESIAKTNNLQLASDLSQELLQVKSQLAHKTHLLERVKVLLTKAAAKERALNEQVSVLQRLVPQSVVHKDF